MFYDPSDDHGLARNPLISCVVPRPIGWISTLNTNGAANLAPFSLFNLVRYAPPTVMFAANGTHADGGLKDTAVNAMETGEFVYNMATANLKEACNQSSAPFGREVDEFSEVGLTKAPSRRVAPPRIAESPVQFECRTVMQVALPGGAPNAVIFGEVVGVHIADWALTNGMIDIPRIRPLARMGYLDFAISDAPFSMPQVGVAKA
ncbi:MAG: flavin reductase family protein [Thalassovita sp.]